MIYDKINLMLPTRGRVHTVLPRFINSILNTTDDLSKIRFTILVDTDDDDTLSYLNETLGLFIPERFHLIINNDTKLPHLAKFYNRLYSETHFNEPGTLVSMVGDDMECITPGWEEMVLNAANDTQGKVVIYGDDCAFQHEKMTVYFFTSRRLVDATGHDFMWDRWRANIIDFVWTEVARKLDCLHYIEKLKIVHHHEANDDTFHRMDPFRRFAVNEVGRAIDTYSNNIVKHVLSSGSWA
jgi:hypothetical protein